MKDLPEDFGGGGGGVQESILGKSASKNKMQAPPLCLSPEEGWLPFVHASSVTEAA